MTGYVRVATHGSIPPGTARAFTIGRYDVAVFFVGGAYYALENSCPHQGGPIADGWVDGDTVTCPWHAWCFNLRSGKMTLGNFASIPTFAVRVDNGGIFISQEPVAA